MKFRDYKNKIDESLKPTIDDSDTLNILQKYSIQNDRTKQEDGTYLYKFDNRYSIIYDGSTFVLYRHEDRIHMENARNLKEIDDAISKWLSSYSLDSVEVNDDEVNDAIDKLVNKVKKNDDDDDSTINDNDEDNKKSDDSFGDVLEPKIDDVDKENTK